MLIVKDSMTFKYVPGKVGIQKVSLNMQELYSTQKERKEFKKRLCQFLKSDSYNSKVIELQDERLVYRTECIIPEKQNSRPPLLLLLGNPASHSVYSEMFFSFEGNGHKHRREHRFWKALREASILSFKSSSTKERKEEMYNLGYDSPFRIGLAVFYSMPSGSSHPKWAGIAGIRKLFQKEALSKIAKCEKDRVEKLIQRFVSPKGVVFAFQKDAYLGVSTHADYDYDKAKKGDLVGFCQCCPNVRLFCLPPTRLIHGEVALNLLRRFKEDALKPL